MDQSARTEGSRATKDGNAEAVTVELSARGTSALRQWMELWLVGQSGSPRAPVTDLLGRIYGERHEGRWP